MGKVKFGLSAFEYGIVDVANKVATTKKLPGMKSAKPCIVTGKQIGRASCRERVLRLV